MKVEENKLREYVRLGYGTDEIARLFDCGKDRIYAAYKRYNIEKPKLGRITEDKLRECLEKGYSIDAMCFRLNVSRGAIYQAIKKYGLEHPKSAQESTNNEAWDAVSSEYEMCEDGAKMLAFGIVEMATQDYKRLIESGEDSVTFAEIGAENRETFRNFFRSQYFEMLSGIITDTRVDSEKIISGIESGNNKKHRKRHDHARNLKGK